MRQSSSVAAASRLLDAGVLAQTTLGRPNRAFEAPDVITAFTHLERRLAVTLTTSVDAGFTITASL